MTEEVDLEAYFARIGYAGPRTPTLATLKALHELHPAAIAFENLDPLLGRRVRLDMGSVQRKLLGEKRGGYCFEQNGLFAQVLRSLGFSVSGLSARVVFGYPPEMARRSHMLLKLDLPEGKYIADVGFGGRAPSAPMRLDSHDEQPTPHGGFRLARTGDFFEQQTRIDGAWQTIYRFSLEEQSRQDYEMANWYVCTHPDSEFRVRLMAARLPRGKRLGLLNNQLSIHHMDGTSERRTLESAAEIAGALETEFAIALPGPREALMQALEGVISRANIG